MKEENFTKQWITLGKATIQDKEHAETKMERFCGTKKIHVKKRRAEHFKDALNKKYPRCNDQGKVNLELSTEGSDEDEHSEMPTYEEIEESIKQIKEWKSTR
jgi:hypothetical protein